MNHPTVFDFFYLLPDRRKGLGFLMASQCCKIRFKYTHEELARKVKDMADGIVEDDFMEELSKYKEHFSS